MADQTISLDYTTSDGRKLPVTFKIPKDRISFDKDGSAFGSEEDKAFIQQAARQALEARYPNEAGVSPKIKRPLEKTDENRAGTVPSPVVQPYHWLDSDNSTQTTTPGTGETGILGTLRRALGGGGAQTDIPIVSPLAKSTGESVRNAIEVPISGKSWQGRTADVIEGAGSLMTAGFAPQLAANPLAAAKIILPAAGLGYGGRVAATALKAKPDTARMTGDLTGLAGAALFGSPKLSGAIAEGMKSGSARASNVPPNKLGGIIGGLGGLATAAKEGVGGFGDYAGYRIGKETGENVHPIEFAKGFVKGAAKGAKGKPTLPFEPAKTDNFQAKVPSKPSPVVASPKALPPSSVIATPPPEPQAIPPSRQITAPTAESYIPPPEMVTSSAQPVQPTFQEAQAGRRATQYPAPIPINDILAATEARQAPAISAAPVAAPAQPSPVVAKPNPVQPPIQPPTQRPIPVTAPKAPAAPVAQAPAPIQAPPEPAVPATPAKANAPVRPPVQVNLPTRATARQLEYNDLFKTPESIVPFIENKVDINANKLASDSGISTDHAAKLLQAFPNIYLV